MELIKFCEEQEVDEKISKNSERLMIKKLWNLFGNG